MSVLDGFVAYEFLRCRQVAVIMNESTECNMIAIKL